MRLTASFGGGDNAVLVCHALSGDAHAAGGGDGAGKPGWWETMIGPGKGIDTDRYFVICANVLGGCAGTTGPSSLNPATGRPYGTDFPLRAIADMVEVERRLLDALGTETARRDRRLHGRDAGSAMGGLLPRAGEEYHRHRHLPPARGATDRLQRGRPAGDHGRSPLAGRPILRQAGSGPGFGRGQDGRAYYLPVGSRHDGQVRPRSPPTPPDKFAPAFAVETYLSHQGEAFVGRFDANSYLYITKALDTFDLAAEAGSLEEALRPFQGRALLLAYSSDWLYPPAQAKEIARAIRRNGGEVTYCELESSYGHDAFLLEDRRASSLISWFLAQDGPARGGEPDYPAS